MSQNVYIASDGGLMDFDSLITWLSSEVGGNLYKRRKWEFDDFTGGIDEFCDEESYLMAKKWFNNYKRRR